MTKSISFLGPENSFTNLALAPTLLELGAEGIPCRDIPEAISKVNEGVANWAFVPVETNLRGTVRSHFNALIRGDQAIRREVVYLAKLALAARADTKEIEAIGSHEHALEECSDWIDANLPNAKLIDAGSSSGGAVLAAKHRGTAAICSAEAASEHGLKVLNPDIANYPGDVTRFFLVGASIAGDTPGDKSTILVDTDTSYAAGVTQLLKSLESSTLEVTRIDTQAAGRELGEYRFVVDLSHLPSSNQVNQLLDALRAKGMSARNLGTYSAVDVEATVAAR